MAAHIFPQAEAKVDPFAQPRDHRGVPSLPMAVDPGNAGTSQGAHDDRKNFRLDGGATCWANPSEFEQELVDVAFDDEAVAIVKRDGLGSAKKRRKIGIALGKGCVITICQRDDPAARLREPFEAVDDSRRHQQKRGRLEAEIHAVRSHRAAAIADKDEVMEVAVEMWPDRPFNRA